MDGMGSGKILLGLFLTALILVGYGYYIRGDPTYIINEITNDIQTSGVLILSGIFIGYSLKKILSGSMSIGKYLGILAAIGVVVGYGYFFDGFINIINSIYSVYGVVLIVSGIPFGYVGARTEY